MNKNNPALSYMRKIELPKPDSHKGDNGKLMIIGGSDLFHAASKWSLDIASKFVDMVFYSSVPANNELVREAKTGFWNGIVVERDELEEYIEEADCILIGPGMTRRPLDKGEGSSPPLSPGDWQDTKKVTDYLLKKYPHKKWVIDAGALQMVNPELLNENCIITPHKKELERLEEKTPREELLQRGATIVLKGKVDFIFDHNLEASPLEIYGGNPGMTKGGTGDVLAGLIAALYSTQEKIAAAVVGSYINKAAGDALHEEVGPNFNASDLVEEVPRTFWREYKKLT